MWLRVLLVAMLFVAAGLGGCKKEEPTMSDQVTQMREDAEDAAEDAQEQAQDMADDAEDMANDMADQAQE